MKKKDIVTVSDGAEDGTEVEKALSQDRERDAMKTTTAAPVAVFNGQCWTTPDGQRFNTRLKAEKYLLDLKNEK
jgi:hypothetical protein